MDEATKYSTLEQCQDEVRRLKEENEHLRRSSESFGALAERLRTTLEDERRGGSDRRRLRREEVQDRRHEPPID